MTTRQKIECLQEKVANGRPIDVLFYDVNSVGWKCVGLSPKNKTEPLRVYMEGDPRFKVTVAKDVREVVRTKLYKDMDIVVTPQQYYGVMFYDSEDMKKDLVENRKIVNVRYSLGWHKIIQRDIYDMTFLNFEDEPDLCERENDVCTGHPWAEYLNKPKEEFTNPWTQPSKLHVLICPHHTVDKGSLYGNYSSFHIAAASILNTTRKYASEVEFAIRPHPNLMVKRVRRMRKLNKNEIDLFHSVRISSGVDYLSWFKHSDAMIHDCGSFRCEYLYMDKPVCYMANNTNMDPTIWSQMGKDAINCHELCWMERGETLDGFVRNLLDGRNDPKKGELRKEYLERHCRHYPNGKTPCENIVNAMLGLEEYART